MIYDRSKKHESQSPVPQWAIGIPVVVGAVAVVILVSGHLGPLVLGLFMLGVYAFMYLYVGAIALWRQRQIRNVRGRDAHETGLAEEPDATRSEEFPLPLPRWLISLPAIGSVVAVVWIADSGLTFIPVALFLMSALIFVCSIMYMMRTWRRRSEENETPRDF